MAVAAGGLIKQSIHRDTYSTDSWDSSSTIVFNVQILNANNFKAMTGETPPKAPRDWKTYKKAGGKFYDIPEASSSLSRFFKGVKSVGQLEGNEDDDDFDLQWDPNSSYPPYWSHLNPLLSSAQPRREFRTLQGIEDGIARSNIVSWRK